MQRGEGSATRHKCLFLWGSSTQGNNTGSVGKCGRSQAGIWSALLDFLPDPSQSSRHPPFLHFQYLFISKPFIIWVFFVPSNHKYSLNRTENHQIAFMWKKRSWKWNFAGLSPDSQQSNSIKPSVIPYPSCQQAGEALRSSSCYSSYSIFKFIFGQKPSLQFLPSPFICTCQNSCDIVTKALQLSPGAEANTAIVILCWLNGQLFTLEIFLTLPYNSQKHF